MQKGGYRMKYISTLNLYSNQIQEAIERGQIKLQSGQWLRCGSTGRRCRFVGVRASGSIWVTHWQGTPTATNAKYLQAVKAFKGR